MGLQAMMLSATVKWTKCQAVLMEPNVFFATTPPQSPQNGFNPRLLWCCLDWSLALMNRWIGFVKMLRRGTESLSQRGIQYFVSAYQGVEFYAPAGTLARFVHANL
jgi:hypothetical protein